MPFEGYFRNTGIDLHGNWTRGLSELLFYSAALELLFFYLCLFPAYVQPYRTYETEIEFNPFNLVNQDFRNQSTRTTGAFNILQHSTELKCRVCHTIFNQFVGKSLLPCITYRMAKTLIQNLTVFRNMQLPVHLTFSRSWNWWFIIHSGPRFNTERKLRLVGPKK